MDELKFEGAVVCGCGAFARDMEIPGRMLLPWAPPEWPDVLARGTLNFSISQMPEPLRARGWSDIKRLDRREFASAFEIPQDAIPGNTLKPHASAPERGRAQVWRAELQTQNGATACWVLRRIKSGYARVLELVSERRMRDELDLPVGENWPASLRLFGAWR